MRPEPHDLSQGAMRRWIAAIVALGFVAAWFASAAGAEVRTWADKSGKFTIKAKFVELSNGKVILEREDGKQLTIALEKLSEADQKVAADLGSSESNPFEAVKPAKKSATKKKTGDEDEEAPGAKPAGKKGAADEGDGDGDDGEGGEGPKVVTTDWSGATELLPSSTNEKWALSIAAPEQPVAAKKGRGIALPGKIDFFEKPSGLVVNPACGRAVVGYFLDRPGQGAAQAKTRIVLCDLKSGKRLGAGMAPGKMAPLALSDSGTQVLMRREEFGPGNQDRLEIWALTRSGIKRELEWTPHDDLERGDRDVPWASYVDEERLATVSSGGILAIWKAASAKPLAFMKIHGGCRPALSPDRKYLAFLADKQVCVLDLATLDVVAAQPMPRGHMPWPTMTFTPRGTRLVCAAFDRVYAWDTATGALYRDISLEGAKIVIGGHFIAPSENHVLIGNSCLMDLESQARIWTYEGHDAAEMFAGVCWFAVSGFNSPGALVSATLPHPAARDLLEKAVHSPDFFVLRPGTTVMLNVAGIQDPGERQKVAAVLAQRLEANGCRVAPNGTIELVASTEMGKREEVSYHTFGQPGSRSYSVQNYLSRLRFVYQGQTAWEAVCGNVPTFLSLKEGETMEQHLRNSERPNHEWFGAVEIPKMLQKPGPGNSTFGTSQVTTTGIR